MAAEIANVVVDAGERGNSVEGNGRRGNEPTRADARGEELNRSKTAGFDKVDTYGVGAGESLGSNAVEIGRWLW